MRLPGSFRARCPSWRIFSKTDAVRPGRADRNLAYRLSPTRSNSTEDLRWRLRCQSMRCAMPNSAIRLPRSVCTATRQVAQAARCRVVEDVGRAVEAEFSALLAWLARLLPQEAVGHLVAHLHSKRRRALLDKGADCAARVPKDGPAQRMRRQVLPRLRLHLVAWIGPPVGVVQIEHKREIRAAHTPCHRQYIGEVCIGESCRYATAIGARVVPEAHAEDRRAV
eukprot:scaffold263065_cov32-Tisochrysis_lutea.AAC.1